MFEKNRKEKWLILALLFVLALGALLLFWGWNAQAKDAKTKPIQIDEIHKKFLPIQNLKTNSGINIWLVEDHSLPIISVQFLFKGAGTYKDPENKQGLVRLLSNTMDEGAGGYDSQAFQKVLSDNSITLMFNAGRDDFGGSLVTLARHKAKAFDLMALALSAPRFDEEPVSRMRDANISRIQSSMSDPDWMAARLLNDKAFEGHPYAQNSGGTISSLESITKEDLRSFHKNYLSQENLLVAVSGDITADEASKSMDAIFSSLPKTPATTARVKSTDIKNQSNLFIFEKDIPQTFVEAIVPAFDDKDPDFYALQVMNYIYGGAGFGSRLMESAREKRGLTYGIYSSLLDMDGVDALSISTSTKNESAQEILTIIKDEMIKLSSQKVGQKELSDAKSYITGSMPLALKSTQDLASIALSLQSKGKPTDYLDHYEDKINAVTEDDVLRVAKRILNPEKMMVVLVGKPASITHAQKIEKLPNVE